MAFLINRVPASRLDCLHSLMRMLYKKYSTDKCFTLNDVKYHEGEDNIKVYCKQLRKYEEFKYCPFLDNPLDPKGYNLPNGTQFVFMEHAKIAAPICDFSEIYSITITPGSEAGVYIQEHPKKFEGISISLLWHANKNGVLRPYSTSEILDNLNESFSFNPFNGCRTFQEKKDRLIDLIKSGMITAGFAMAIISTMTPNKATQEQIKQEVMEVSTEAENTRQNANIEAIPKFDENVVFATDWKISNDGIKHIKRYEKFSATPYYATKKDKDNDVKTIGYGHVIKESDPDWLKTAKSITEEEASILFEKDIDSFGRLFKYEIAPTLNRGLRTPEAFPQVMMDAMLSMMYNSGNGNFKKDSINPFYARLKNCRVDKESGKIDKRDYDYTIASIPNSLIYHRGEVMKGLQNRRQTEYKMAAQAK